MSELDNSLLMLELRRQKHELHMQFQASKAALRIQSALLPGMMFPIPHCSYCGMSHSTDGRCTSCGAPVSRPVILPKSYPCY